MEWKQLLCIATFALLIGQSESATTPTPTPTTPTTTTTTAPPIDYTCFMNKTIIIKPTGVLATSHSIAIGQTKDESSALSYITDLNNCQHAKYAIPSPNNQDIILKGCDIDKPIYVYLMDHNSTNIVGGKNNHGYELNCYFPDEGIPMVVTLEPVSVVSPGAYSNESHKFDLGDIGLTMTLSSTTPHLGEKLTLTIKETKQAFFVLPMECTATGSDKDNTETQKLLINGTTEDVNLLENFDVTIKGSAVASLYAFRFKTSDVVHISCNVTVCRTKACGGVYTTTAGSRRRRSVEDATTGRTYDVSAAFKILDNDPNESSSSSTSVAVNPILIGLSALCLWAGASCKTY